MGYSVIGSTHKGIEASTRYFVPMGESLEIWQFTITNHRDTAATLSAYSLIEFASGMRRMTRRTFSGIFNRADGG